MDYAVETISLTKTFADGWGRRKVFAVNDLNLKIKPNEVFGLLGPNGSGKTTTIKMLLGLLHPTRGHAFLLGGSGADPKINMRIGFLPEESYLYKYLNPRETLDFYGRLFGLSRRIRKERIESLLDMVGLKAVAGRHVGSFSKGMARRIGLAQALINDPDLLILDEPTTGLDPLGTRQIKDLILHLAKRGKTILLCSHLLADVEDVCDRIAILYGGKVQAEGSVGGLLQQADKRQITTGALSDEALARIRKIVEDENTAFSVSPPMEKLETYFVRTVTEAQKQAHPTSGAVSTTRIGGFLAPDDASEPSGQDVLTGLVRGQEERTESAARTESTQPVSPAEVQDTSVLDELTQTETDRADQAKRTDTSRQSTTPTQKPDSIPDEQGDKDVLDQLVDPSQKGDPTTDRPKTGEPDHG